MKSAFKLRSGNSPLYKDLSKTKGTLDSSSKKPIKYSNWQANVEKIKKYGQGQSYTGKDIYQQGKRKRDDKRRQRQTLWAKIRHYTSGILD